MISCIKPGKVTSALRLNLPKLRKLSKVEADYLHPLRYCAVPILTQVHHWISSNWSHGASFNLDTKAHLKFPPDVPQKCGAQAGWGGWSRPHWDFGGQGSGFADRPEAADLFPQLTYVANEWVEFAHVALEIQPDWSRPDFSSPKAVTSVGSAKWIICQSSGTNVGRKLVVDL